MEDANGGLGMLRGGVDGAMLDHYFSSRQLMYRDVPSPRWQISQLLGKPRHASVGCENGAIGVRVALYRHCWWKIEGHFIHMLIHRRSDSIGTFSIGEATRKSRITPHGRTSITLDLMLEEFSHPPRDFGGFIQAW